MKRAILYARTSTELQKKDKTIESQVAEVEKFAEENKYEILEQYLDDGWSGTLLARPALDRLRDEAQEGLFEAVLIYDPDRLARKFAYQALVTEELEELGIDVVFINRPKAETPEDKILQGFQGLFAEYERAKILERTRRGKLHKARNNKIIGNYPPYGYRYIPKTKRREGSYSVDEKEARVVKMIFDWVANQGCSLHEVRRRLHEKGIKARKSRSTRWQNSTLSRLLRNETYIGTTYYNKTLSVIPKNPRETDGYKRVKKSSRKYKKREEWIAIDVPAIVDTETFYKAQEQLKKNAFFSKRNQKRHYLLSGLVFCGECESRMAGDGTSRKSSSKTYSYYRCTERIRKFPKESSCIAKSISAELIEKVIWSKICEVLNDPERVLKQLEEQRSKQKKLIEQIVSQDESFDKKLETLDVEEKRLVKAYREKVLSLSQLKEQMEEITEGRKSIKDEKKKLLSESKEPALKASPDVVKNYCEKIRDQLPDFTPEDKQQLLRLLVEKIIVNGKQVKIHGIFPAIQDISQDLLRSDSRIGLSTSGSRGGRFFPFPSILHHCRPSR